MPPGCRRQRPADLSANMGFFSFTCQPQLPTFSTTPISYRRALI
jgi:hypothetical protein